MKSTTQELEIFQSHKWLLEFVQKGLKQSRPKGSINTADADMIAYAQACQDNVIVLKSGKLAASVCLDACEGLDMNILDTNEVKLRLCIDAEIKALELTSTLSEIRDVIKNTSDDKVSIIVNNLIDLAFLNQFSNEESLIANNTTLPSFENTWQHEHPDSLDDLDLSFLHLGKWLDTSSHNDSCASFSLLHDDEKILVLHIDYKNKFERDTECENRFYLRLFPIDVNQDEGGFGLEFATGEEPVLYAGNDFDMLKSVIGQNVVSVLDNPLKP
jgi:hypothetical protein